LASILSGRRGSTAASTTASGSITLNIGRRCARAARACRWSTGSSEGERENNANSFLIHKTQRTFAKTGSGQTFTQEKSQKRIMAIFLSLRFAHISNADTQQLVDERNNSIPEWMRLTDEILLNADTKKAQHVVQALEAKHIRPPPSAESEAKRNRQKHQRLQPAAAAGAAAAAAAPAAAPAPAAPGTPGTGAAAAGGVRQGGGGGGGSSSVGKTLVYSLYNGELYIAMKQMQRVGGWSDGTTLYGTQQHTFSFLFVSGSHRFHSRTTDLLPAQARDKT
jgi:hypothetical protein